MVRAPSFDSNGMKKGAWSEDEDNKLRAFVLTYGHSNWRLLPNYAGLKRCGKSCRLRWMNHLKPGVKRGSFSKEEEDLIIKLHAKIGNKWSAIAAELPERKENDIKNFWNARIARRRKPNSLPTQPSSYSSSSMDDQLLEMPPNNQTDSLIKNIDESTMTFDTNSLLLPATQAQSQPQMDLWGDANCSQSYAQLLDEEFCYDPQLYYNEFFSPDMNIALDWINADDQDHRYHV